MSIMRRVFPVVFLVAVVIMLSGCSPKEKEAVKTSVTNVAGSPTVTSSDTNKSTIPASGTASLEKNAPIFSEKKLTIQFVNQYGEPYRGACILDCGGSLSSPTLFDSVGEKVGYIDMTGNNQDPAGLRELGKEIPSGTYTLQWGDIWLWGAKIGGRVSVQRKMEKGEAKFTVPNDGNWFVSVPVKQTNTSYFYGGQSISMTIKNEAGTPLELEYLDSKVGVHNADDKNIGTISSNGKKRGEYTVFPSGMEESSVPGVYTIKIKKNGYKAKTVEYTLPDVSDWTDEMIVAKKPGVIDLGVVTLEKE